VTAGPPAPAGSRLALAVLVALVVLSPWPFGSVHLRTTQAIALVSLATALAATAWDAWKGRLQLPSRLLLWPLFGLWLLAVFQLLPIPEALHKAIAPGSAAVWHPPIPQVAAVLGEGPHPISLYPDATRRWLAFATGLVALALAAAPALRHRRELLKASTAVVAGAVLLALYAFVARLAFGSKLYGLWTVPTVAPFGPFVSKNHFAGYVELAALLALGLATGLRDEARHGPEPLSWIESRRAQWVVIAYAAAAILILAVPVSLSRGGVVSLAAGLVAFVALRLWSRKASPLSTRNLVLAAAGLVAVLAVTIAVLPHESRARVLTLTGITTEQSGSYRLALWKDTLRLAASSPVVGSGFGAYEDALPRFKTANGNFRVEHAENDHLELLAEGGLLGTGLGATAVLVLLFLATTSLREGNGRFPKALHTGAVAGLVALYVHSAFDFNLRIPSNALLAALLAATLVPAAGKAAHESPLPRRLAAGLALPAALTLLVALLTPWTQAPWDPTLLRRVPRTTTTALRTTTLKVVLTGHLHGRPAHAGPWLQLAWLSLHSQNEDPTPFAEWATTLDPQNEWLRQTFVRIRATR
jgi:O-antigen ligase